MSRLFDCMFVFNWLSLRYFLTLLALIRIALSVLCLGFSDVQS